MQKKQRPAKKSAQKPNRKPQGTHAPAAVPHPAPKPVRFKLSPRNAMQAAYLDSIDRNDVVFGLGPAGTGKTFLAAAAAVEAYQAGEVERIILVRPAVEAGEKLGFLPGDLKEKVDPYMRPFYDALYEMLGKIKVEAMIEEETIEIAPLAFMRGRTLKGAFVIMDEAQNTTVTQMHMLLTRLGPGSKAVITGDASQCDLPSASKCGLTHAVRLLRRVEGIDVVEFQEEDVVRHKLVQRIVRAYEKEAHEQHK